MRRRLHRKYSYRVIWSEDKKKHIGKCAEFPHFESESSSIAGALMRLTKVIEAEVDRIEASGQKPPEPLISKKFSGDFIVRTSPEVHRKLMINAAEQDVSFNHYVSGKLADL